MSRPAQPHAQEPSFAALPALELRVLSGAQAGARADLRPSQALSLAAGPALHWPEAESADLLLQAREPALLRLQLEGPMCRAELLQGQALLGEQRLQAGDAFDWPAHCALQLGPDLVLAFGERTAAIWSLHPASARTTSTDETLAMPELSADGVQAAGQTAGSTGPARRHELWLAAAGAGLALAGLAWAWQGRPAAPAPARDPMPVLQALISQLQREPEFAALQLSRDAQGQPVLSGRVVGQSQQAQLQQRLLALGLRPPLPSMQALQVDSQLAAAVEELLQMQGFQARANVFGLGQVQLEPAAPAASGAQPGPSPEAWQQALAQLRSALPQLRSLELNAPPAPVRADATALAASEGRLPTLPSAGAEPGKRIVALVSQGLPHLITADGARYFVGAVLPSGHRLVAVQPQALLLEREGRTSRIDF
ncbi:MAG: hypothetical protein CFE41_07590 [Burkholderiales bacterium PBB2]|nr:MAG: hypothetical protein CFE41_07590 [Burkholderiales bacterium PBB2]